MSGRTNLSYILDKDTSAIFMETNEILFNQVSLNQNIFSILLVISEVFLITMIIILTIPNMITSDV
jgi:hypothetical protein